MTPKQLAILKTLNPKQKSLYRQLTPEQRRRLLEILGRKQASSGDFKERQDASKDTKESQAASRIKACDQRSMYWAQIRNLRGK